MSEDLNHIEPISWKNAREFIHRINPHLAAEFDKIVGIEQLSVLKVRYPYGSTIIQRGKFFLYHEGQSRPWNDPAIPEKIRALLDYPWRVIPFGIVYSNTFESFVELPTHIVPLRLMSQGNTFSLLSIFEKDHRYLIENLQSATAGARSLFVLPQITHKQYSRRLVRRFKIPPECTNPKEYHEHFYLLKALSNAPGFRSSWHCELLLFTKPFMDRIDQYYRLKAFLLQLAWSSTAFARNEGKYDMLWSVFVYHNLGASLRSPVVLETAKHLIKMIIRRVPGFAPARSDQAGPSGELMNVFSNIYKIRYHLPIIMQPYMYDGVNPLYYSLQHFTLFHAIPGEKAHGQLMRELEDIRFVMLSFIEQMNHNHLWADLKETVFFESLNSVDVDFFHISGEGNIRRDIEDIPAQDERFTEFPKGVMKKPGLEFPAVAQFFRGCIRIKPKES